MKFLNYAIDKWVSQKNLWTGSVKIVDFWGAIILIATLALVFMKEHSNAKGRLFYDRFLGKQLKQLAVYSFYLKNYQACDYC